MAPSHRQNAENQQGGGGGVHHPTPSHVDFWRVAGSIHLVFHWYCQNKQRGGVDYHPTPSHVDFSACCRRTFWYVGGY